MHVTDCFEKRLEINRLERTQGTPTKEHVPSYYVECCLHKMWHWELTSRLGWPLHARFLHLAGTWDLVEGGRAPERFNWGYATLETFQAWGRTLTDGEAKCEHEGLLLGNSFSFFTWDNCSNLWMASFSVWKSLDCLPSLFGKQMGLGNSLLLLQNTVCNCTSVCKRRLINNKITFLVSLSTPMNVFVLWSHGPPSKGWMAKLQNYRTARWHCNGTKNLQAQVTKLLRAQLA